MQVRACIFRFMHLCTCIPLFLSLFMYLINYIHVWGWFMYGGTI
ncbi:unnamed protein product [Linum tenue]|uniref:Uncharacterized protein n=1 Tax=Linum tenue TaxID=586396 RepID=A0AAV0HXG7_9ROSI|nr:unnamed protein product [Linum tenue]